MMKLLYFTAIFLCISTNYAMDDMEDEARKKTKPRSTSIEIPKENKQISVNLQGKKASHSCPTLPESEQHITTRMPDIKNLNLREYWHMREWVARNKS